MAETVALEVEYSLFLRICEAKELPIKDRLARSSDPYVVVTGMGAGKSVRSKTVFKELNPFYGEEYNMAVAPGSSVLTVQVWDEDKKGTDDIMGVVNIPLTSVAHERVHEQWYPLGDPSGPGDGSEFVSGEVHLRVTYDPPDDPVPGKITVVVVEGRGLAAKDSNGLSDPYVKVKHGKSKVKTSTKTKTLDPVYNEELAIDIPVGDESPVVTVSVWDYDKMSANDFMGVITLFLDELEPGHTYDEWFTLCSSITATNAGGAGDADEGDAEGVSSASLGSIRLKLHYKEEEILPLEKYDAFSGIVMRSGLHALQALGKVTSDRNDIAYHLIRIYEGEGYDQTVELLSELTTTEIRATPNPQVMFRGNSLATKALDLYMQMIALPYLHATLGTIIRSIYTSSEDAEVDPTRLDESADLDANWSRLKALAASAVDEIFRSIDAIPTTLRVVFEAMRGAVAQTFPDDDVASFTAVSGFLFLRLFCAAILGPKLFGLAQDHPDAKTSRVLTLISKTVQNLANLAEFGPKEPYMAPMNEFIVANIPRMKNFLTEVSTVGDDFVAHDSQFINKARERAALVAHFVSDRADLETHAASLDAASPEGAALAELFPILDNLEALRAAGTRPVIKSATSGASSVASPAAGAAAAADVAGPSDAAASPASDTHPAIAKLSITGEERKENMRKLLQIQTSLSKCDVKKSLASRDRIFIRESSSMMKVSKKKMQGRTFFLMSDMLLYGEAKKGNAVKFSGMIPMSKLVVVHPSAASDLGAEQFRVINLLKKKVIDLHCNTQEECRTWASDCAILSKRARGFHPLNGETQALADKILGTSCVEWED